MSVTVNNNSPIQDYIHLDDQNQPTFKMSPGFKLFTIFKLINFFMNIKQLIMIGRAKSQGLGIMLPSMIPLSIFLGKKRLNKNLKEPPSC